MTCGECCDTASSLYYNQMSRINGPEAARCRRRSREVPPSLYVASELSRQSDVFSLSFSLSCLAGAAPPPPEAVSLSHFSCRLEALSLYTFTAAQLYFFFFFAPFFLSSFAGGASSPESTWHALCKILKNQCPSIFHI